MQESNVNSRQDISVTRAVTLGFRVLFSEIHWEIQRGLRNWEIADLQNRMAKEYERLGKLLEQEGGESAKNTLQSEIDLCRKQIAFLSREVEHLQTQLRNLRQDIIARRRKKWNV